MALGAERLLTTTDYLSLMVQAAAEEFCHRNSEVRLALGTCMATLHVIDHVVQN